MATNDLELANRMSSAFQAALAGSDPYFRNQIRIAQDALLIGIQSEENTLKFAERQKSQTLADLKEDILSQKDYLGFEQADQLESIVAQYEQDLGVTRDALAATGFTSSSRRATKEQYLSDAKEGLVESTDRKFGFQQEQLDRTLSRGERDTAQEIARLREIAAENQTKLLHGSESKIGTSNLPTLPSTTTTISPMGGLPGDIERERNQDALQFANAFVF